MMASIRLAIMVSLSALVCFPSDTSPRAAARTTAALIGTVRENSDKSGFLVIGGVAHGTHWVGSDTATGLMHDGDPLSVCHLGANVIGRARLTSGDRTGPEAPLSKHESGVAAYAQLLLTRQQWATFEKVSKAGLGGIPLPLVGIWHSRSAPAPRWIPATLLKKESRTYRRVIVDWLLTKRVARSVVRTVVVDQLVRADINGDRRDEVFIAFRSANTPGVQWVRRPTATTFSYLLMRYVPRRSQQAAVVVIDDFPNVAHEVIGICDLDGDGWGEVAARHVGVDAWGTTLHHWVGSSFASLEGWGGGV